MADDETQESRGRDEYGILLYYKYTTIPDLGSLLSFYEDDCHSHGLLGRVRLSPQGVNVTVGGKLSSLEEHMATLKLNSMFEGTDFKLASCHKPLNDKVAKECGFTSLSIRVVEELVTFSAYPLFKTPEVSNAGRHLSADEFHAFLQDAGQLLGNEGTLENESVVLLDARNLYETRIGKFQTPQVDTLDPEIRQYSDLPAWIDNNADKLQGKNVLMYCTGGIRCEMASAYIRSKGVGFEKVFQLFGGIQRYLEEYPDGGFFKGKNFVFDHRISVGSSDSKILGKCLHCSASFDDYSSRCRCIYCRMLVLVCYNCMDKGLVHVCELCKKYGKVIKSVTSVKHQSHQSKHDPVPQLPCRNGMGPRKKLRILCLHGFRQNASSFKGRTASLAKKLNSVAELVFIDAPHEVDFVYQPHNKKAWEGRAPPEKCRRKFAWVVESGSEVKAESSWKIADGAFDPLQYKQQTSGLDESLECLKRVFSEKGPFDGILGFSQGAAMAASLCALHESLTGEIRFRFVILCSGFVLSWIKCRNGSIQVPSLHVYGRERGKDRQIRTEESRELASLFESGCSVVVEHDCGHIIPTRPPYIDQVKDFLNRFVSF